MISGKVELDKKVSRAIRRWQNMPISPVLAHESECCINAKEWFVTLDASLLNSDDSMVGPTWISEKFGYGPSRWPLHWCDLVQKDSLSCNGFTSVACLLFEGRGLISFPVQVIQHYPKHMTQRWRKEWKSRRLLDEWIYDGLVRHEVCGVLDGDNSLRLWDGTVGYWLEHGSSSKVGAVLAMRPLVWKGNIPKELRWYGQKVMTNEWTKFVMEANEE